MRTSMKCESARARGLSYSFTRSALILSVVETAVVVVVVLVL